MEESTLVNGWLAQGEARGQIAEARKILLRLGAKRFGAPASTETEAAIRAISDSDRLERMTDRILDANSWDELLATP